MPRGEYDEFMALVCRPALIVSGGRVVAASGRLACLTGYSASELIGMSVRGLVAAEERPQGSRPPSRRGFAPGSHNGLLITKDGPRIGARFFSRTLNHGSRPGGMLVVFDDTAGQDGGAISVPYAERLLEDCLRSAEAGVVVIGRNGLVALANRKCCEILGYDEVELIGRSWTSVFASRRDRRRASEYFDGLVTGKVQPDDYYETALTAKGGQKKVVSWHHVMPLRSASGNSPGLVSSLLDITEQKRVTKTLRDQDRLYRLVSENATAGIWTYDIGTGKVTYMSPSISQVTGFTSQQVMDLDISQRVPASSLKEGIAELKRQLALDRDYQGRSHSWTMELEEYRSDGSTMWVESRTSIVRDPQGRPVSIFGVTRDITERKNAEKALLESEKRYRTFFENSMDATCIINRNGRVIDTNRAALALLGYTREELIGRSLEDIAPGDQRREFQSRIEKFGFVRNFEMRIRRQDGVDLDCLLTFDLRTDDYGGVVGYEGSIRDITEWKRLQRNLRLYVNEVTRAQESERLRLSRELHDGVLQNLLALGLELEKAIRAEAREGRSQERQLQHIRDEVRRLAREMRALSHALRPGVLDELGLVAAVQTLLRGLEETRGIATDLVVLGAESRLDGELELALFRIVQEALSNVKRHSEAGSVRVRIEFASGSVKALVSDDGRGFEAPGWLGDLASAGRLGLIGMEERARMLGGELHLQSQPGSGTTVMVEIPCGGEEGPGR